MSKKHKKRRSAYAIKTAMSFEGILDAIHGDCASVDQWVRGGHYSFAAKYQSSAEALIELVEIHLTGSCGATHGGWGLKHTKGLHPRINATNITETDIKARLNVLVKELKFRKLISQDFQPNYSSEPQ